MSHSSVAAMMDTAAEVLVYGAWSGVGVAMIALFEARWGRRLLNLVAGVLGVLSLITAAAYSIGSLPALTFELGNWLTLDSFRGIGLTYRIDFVACVILAAVSFVVLIASREREAIDDESRVFLTTLWWCGVFTAAMQFALLSSPVLRFAFWELLAVGALLRPMVATNGSPSNRDRHLFLVRLAGDACILFAIVSKLQPVPAVSTTTLNGLLFLGVAVRVITAFPPVGNRDAIVDRVLIAPLGLLWLPVDSQIVLVAGVLLLGAVGGLWTRLFQDGSDGSTASTANALWPIRCLKLLPSAIRGFETHVIDGAWNAVAQLPRRFDEAGEPLRNRSGRYYACTLAVATLALLAGIVGWRIAR